jgi:Tfp pilus assembly protein PilF
VKRFPGPFSSTARCNLPRNDTAQVIAHYRKALEINPNNAHARAQLQTLGAPMSP